MRARRTQLYWFPVVSTALVVAGWGLLDIPGRVALVRGDYGIQLWQVDASALVLWSVVTLAALWTVQATTDRPRRPSPVSHHVYYAAFGVLSTDVLFLAGAHGKVAADAGVPVWVTIAVVPAAWCGRHVASRLEDARAAQEGWDTGPVRRPTLRLGPGEKALWIGRREGPGGLPMLLAWTFIAVVVVATMVASRGLTPGLVLQAAFIAATLLYGYVTYAAEVTVSEWGVVVRGGALRFPFWRIPLNEIVEARAEDVRPGIFGGYGYLAKGGRRCLVVRAGPGLLLRRRTGRDVLVTVEGAEEGAGLVNALAGRGERAETF